MGDWNLQQRRLYGAVITSGSAGFCDAMNIAWMARAATSSAVWPAANRAIYMAFTVDETVTAYNMGFNVATQSGNYDAGLYDIDGNRLVSVGSTAVPATGIAVANIADTVLTPGYYFMALCIDNTTASITRSATGTAGSMTVGGVQDQDVGAVTLPNPATFSALGSAYVPALSVSIRTTW